MTQEDLQKNNEHLVALLMNAFQTSLQKLEDKMDARFAESESRMTAGFERVDANAARLEDKMDSGFQTLSEEVIELKVQMRGMHVRLGVVENSLGRVENRLGRVETRLGKVETRLDGVDHRLGNLEIDMTQVKHGVTALLEDNEKHDKDISSLKKVVASPFSA